MRKATFQGLLVMMIKRKKKNSVLKASMLSGYPRSSYYYRPKQRLVVDSNSRNSSINNRSD
ncbi:MAG: hypothetical protein AB7V56_11600 [Candidatus Nitrosocosmicus sp.]